MDSSAVPIPSPRQIKGKVSFDALSSAPTSRSQPEVPRKESFTGRRPGGSVGEGFKGFQFPLVTKSNPANPPNPITPGRPQPPPLTRMHSAAPTIPLPSNSPSRPIPSQLSLVPPTRPPMMRQASVAVMEGRAQSQAQALALAQAQEGPLSPTKNLALPRSGAGGPVGMMRSRSGSRVDAEGLAGGMGLRDLLKVSGGFIAVGLTSPSRFRCGPFSSLPMLIFRLAVFRGTGDAGSPSPISYDHLCTSEILSDPLPTRCSSYGSEPFLLILHDHRTGNERRRIQIWTAYQTP